jgi:2-keto-4-pentenoate hydratase/2-oxohepta-3-ene-1,7-dioic acid hydratase in catechol pathway
MKIICVGRNYKDHAAEMKNDVPVTPILFMKPKSAMLMPEKPLYYPEFTDDLQYECELIIRINKNGKFIQEKFAKKYYGEVSVGIDFTARDVQREHQKKGLPWELAKAFDGSAAVGRFIPITPDMDVQNLPFNLRLNDEVVQDDNSKSMIFSVDHIIAYASNYFTLNIGDIIFTGTPAGVGQVNGGDKLEGYLAGEKLLEVYVK